MIWRWRSCFSARASKRATGDADALIKSLGRRLAQGDHDGIWDYSVPREHRRADADRATRSRRAQAPQGRAE